MERIVQLSDSEYEELCDKANKTDLEIKNQVKRIWKERAAAEIEIRIKSSRGYDDIITLDCSSYVMYRDGRFEIPYELRQRFSESINRMVERRVTELVGKPLELRNSVQHDANRIKKQIGIFYAICFSGWGAFIGCLLYFLLS